MKDTWEPVNLSTGRVSTVGRVSAVEWVSTLERVSTVGRVSAVEWVSTLERVSTVERVST